MVKLEELRNQIYIEQRYLDTIEDDYKRAKSEIELDYQYYNDIRDRLQQVYEESHQNLINAVRTLQGVTEESYQEALHDLLVFSDVTDQTFHERVSQLDEKLDNVEYDYHKRRNNQEDKLSSLKLQVLTLEKKGKIGGN